jgi:SAM-dependent methyltransferase
MSKKFISCRRSHLDNHLGLIKNELRGKVLDVGGRRAKRRGIFLPPFESVVSWITLNPNKIEIADVVGALPHLPFADRTFDSVLCTEVLEYVETPDSAIREMARVLVFSGTLYLSVPFLHSQHGDSDADRYRFTSTYLRQQFRQYFHVFTIFPMGGIASVVFDLLWQRLRSYRVLRPLLRTLGPIIVERDFPASDITTGFFIVARMPKI